MKLFKNWRLRKPHQDEESVYISEKFGVRTLHIGSDTVQSAMRIARPNDLEVVYTRSMMAWLLFNPDPGEIVMIGLGGGSLAKFIYHRLPRARALAVEVNPQVVTIAREYFQLPLDGDRLQVIIADGAHYLSKQTRSADVILVDGYDAKAQVASLATLDFYRDCARNLSSEGMVVINLWGGDRDFSTCVERLALAFDRRIACLPAGKPGNVVAIGFKRSLGEPRWEILRQRARILKENYGLEFPRFVDELAVMNSHDSEKLLL